MYLCVNRSKNILNVIYSSLVCHQRLQLESHCRFFERPGVGSGTVNHEITLQFGDDEYLFC